jgi:hypothetical protein
MAIDSRRTTEGTPHEDPGGYDPMLDPLHQSTHGGHHAHAHDLGRVLPYYIALFLLAPLIQYALTHLAHLTHR